MIAVVILALGGLLVVAYGGLADVAATTPHSDLVEWYLVTARESAIASEVGDLEVPPLDDPALLRTGVEHYHAMCATCHGAPGIEPGEAAQGLNPLPPELHGEDGEEGELHEESPARTFWIVKHGIKMTGMPAFGPTHSDEDLWAVTALVQELEDMSPTEYAERVRRAGLELSTGHEHAEGGHHGEGGEVMDDHHGEAGDGEMPMDDHHEDGGGGDGGGGDGHHHEAGEAHGGAGR